jgi:hypothetical protein
MISTEKIVEFRAGKYDIDPTYRSNSEHISDLLNFISSIKADSTIDIVSVLFKGSTSPDGSYEVNRSLADKRLNALEKLVRSNIQIPDSIITRDSDYLRWNDLRNWVANSETPYKDEVIDILNQEPKFVSYGKSSTIDSRLKELQTHRHGKCWNYIYHNYFAQMRNAGSVFISTIKQQPAPLTPRVEIEEPIKELCTDTIVTMADTIAATQPTEHKPWYIGIKTNLLYDLAATPNIGLDVYLGKQWSIDANWMYAWWKTDVHHRYWRVYGGDLAVRKWFGKKALQKPLTGHHIGVYGQILTTTSSGQDVAISATAGLMAAVLNTAIRLLLLVVSTLTLPLALAISQVNTKSIYLSTTTMSGRSQRCDSGSAQPSSKSLWFG